MESINDPKNECYEIEIPFNLYQYLSSQNCNIQILCRICLSEDNKQLFPLISDKQDGLLKEMFTSLTTIQVYAGDGLPSSICDLCRSHVINCYEFRARCMKSDYALKSLLNVEFVTKDEPKEEVQWINENKLPAETSVHKMEINFSDIKKEDIIEDLQYLEDLSGSDSETLSIVQKTDNNINDKLVETVPDTNSILLDVTSNNAKEIKSKTHVCSFCSKRFRHTKALKSHVKRAHGSARSSHACGLCSRPFHSPHDLALHQPEHAPGPPWACVQCRKEFQGRSMFRRHIQRHMEMKRYSCEVCEKPFAELYALRRHSRVHTGEIVEKRHACHLCDKRYSESGLLAAHIARHNNSRPCVCAVCGKSFPSARLLTSHHLVHSEDKPYKCRYCDKKFRHESTLRTHHRTHTGDKPYVCATCGKRFIQNSNLTLHMRTHTGERPYSCETCGRSFSSGSTLKSHLRTHTGDKPYSCPVCGKRFARADLRAHLLAHSGERPFPCGVCARRFATAARRRDHERVHTGEKAFECATCTQKFASKSNLLKHFKTHQNKKKIKQTHEPSHMKYKQSFTEKLMVNNDNNMENILGNSENIAIMDVVDSDSKEIIVEATQDDTEVAGELLLPDMTEAQNIHTGTLCLTTGVNDMSYASDVNLVTVDEGEVRISSTGLEGATVKLYQVDQSLLQIHSSRGQVTISKITSKMTANF